MRTTPGQLGAATAPRRGRSARPLLTAVLGWVLATRVLTVPYAVSPWVWLVGLIGGTGGVLVAGLVGTRRVLHSPPMEIFRAAG